MTMMSDTNTVAIPAQGATRNVLVRAWNVIADRYTRYAAYRRTVAEMSALSSRDLRDLFSLRSITRSMAHEQACRLMSFRNQMALSSSLGPL